MGHQWSVNFQVIHVHHQHVWMVCLLKAGCLWLPPTTLLLLSIFLFRYPVTPDTHKLYSWSWFIEGWMYVFGNPLPYNILWPTSLFLFGNSVTRDTHDLSMSSMSSASKSLLQSCLDHLSHWTLILPVNVIHDQVFFTVLFKSSVSLDTHLLHQKTILIYVFSVMMCFLQQYVPHCLTSVYLSTHAMVVPETLLFHASACNGWKRKNNVSSQGPQWAACITNGSVAIIPGRGP